MDSAFIALRHGALSSEFICLVLSFFFPAWPQFTLVLVHAIWVTLWRCSYLRMAVAVAQTLSAVLLSRRYTEVAVNVRITNAISRLELTSQTLLLPLLLAMGYESLDATPGMETIKSRRLEITILGEQGAGKSHLVARLSGLVCEVGLGLHTFLQKHSLTT